MLNLPAALSSIGLLLMVLGCSPTATTPPTATPPALAETLIFYDWEEDMPQVVLDAFTAEFEVEVNYQTYDLQTEAMANIQVGEQYDVVVFDNDRIPDLIAEELLAEIDYHHVPNFKNVSANFRDLAYDPGNKYSIPYSWGTTGLVIRTDLVAEPPRRWADLWQPRYTGQVAVRNENREGLGVALKALGYSINSEEPAELEAALAKLLEMQPSFKLVEETAEKAMPLLLSGEVAILVGWAEDVMIGRAENAPISYILPEDGPMLWGDNFVIPANSPHKYTAEVFLNFLLRPDINAMLVNESYYATANQAAAPFIEPAIRNDPVIFPPNDRLKQGDIFMPLSPEGRQLSLETWQRYLAARARD